MFWKILSLLLAIGLSIWFLPAALASILSVAAIWFFAHFFPIRYPTRENVILRSHQGLGAKSTLLMWGGIIAVTVLFFVLIFR